MTFLTSRVQRKILVGLGRFTTFKRLLSPSDRAHHRRASLPFLSFLSDGVAACLRKSRKTASFLCLIQPMEPSLSLTICPPWFFILPSYLWKFAVLPTIDRIILVLPPLPSSPLSFFLRCFFISTWFRCFSLFSLSLFCSPAHGALPIG